MLAVSFGLFCLPPKQASADLIGTWDFSWTDPTNGPESASLSLDLTPTTTLGIYAIHSITGTFDGSSAVTGPNGYAGADNLFHDQAYPADGNGIGFAVGGVDYNIYQSDFFGSPANYFNLPVTSSSTSISGVSVPEPSSLHVVLFGVGVYCISLARSVRRSRRAD